MGEQPDRDSQRRFKIYKKQVPLALPGQVTGQEVPLAGNCIQIRKAAGILTITTNKGDFDENVEGETVRFDNGFTSLRITSTVANDPIEVSIGYGFKINPRGVFTPPIPPPITGGNMIVATFEQAGGGGGPVAPNVWTQYPLNNLPVNDGGIAAFVGSNLVLPPGDYEIRGGGAQLFHFWVRAIQVIRLDTAATIAKGITFYQGVETDGSGDVTLTPAKFTLAATTQIQMQFITNTPYVANPPDANDLGVDQTGVTGYAANMFGFLWLEKTA